MTAMRLVIFFFVIFICKQESGTIYQCDSTSSTILTRIVGGEPAAQGSWSWTVSFRENGNHFCEGSILSPLFIVTTAHCTDVITNLANITILAGSVNLVPFSPNKVYQIRSIAQIYKHPSYDPVTLNNDIALVRLSSPLNITNGNLKPICLPTGITVQPIDNIDMTVQVTVQSVANTMRSYKWLIYNSQLQFCAGLTSGVKGDSGGSLMSFVHGLSSYGYGCVLSGYPEVYTQVSYYIAWIESITQSYELKTATTSKSTTSTTIRSWLLNLLSETFSNETDCATKDNLLKGSLLQTSNSAKYSIIQSLFIMYFLPIITSTYSFLLLFLL